MSDYSNADSRSRAMQRRHNFLSQSKFYAAGFHRRVRNGSVESRPGFPIGFGAGLHMSARSRQGSAEV
jgi:hypothetical protein